MLFWHPLFFERGKARQLAKELFNFDYRWEVYKPVSERRYGYYVLPVVARFEAGRDKKSRALIIKNWWWEPGVNQSAKMHSELLHCCKQWSSYLEQPLTPISANLQKKLDQFFHKFFCII
jgi:hypothetical protein